LFLNWYQAIIFGVCFLIWSFLPWGRWYDLGRLPDNFIHREPTWFEKQISKISSNDHIAFTIRNSIAIIPAVVLVSPWFAFLPLLQLACYELAWRFRPKEPIMYAEIGTGAVWGGLFVIKVLVP
jgi:hypothetical protein